MDVEKTIEFLLENQARMQAAADAETVRVKGEMDAIRQTLQETAFIQLEQARILVRIESNVAELSVAQKELAGSQQVTETKLQALIEALRRGSNGSNGNKQ